jgi:putative transposase
MQEVLHHYRGSSYQLHAYVIMPDHFHILISPVESLERPMQNIKGGFSFRAKKAFEWPDDIWQVGFSDHRIRDSEDWDRHVGYISHNPVKAHVCERSEDYPYLAIQLDPIPQRLKPPVSGTIYGGAEAPPLQKQEPAINGGTGVPALQKLKAAIKGEVEVLLLRKQEPAINGGAEVPALQKLKAAIKGEVEVLPLRELEPVLGGGGS